MHDLLKRFAAWLAEKTIFPLATAVPGLPYLFRRQIINEYLNLATEVRLDSKDALVVSAMLDVTIKPWHSLSQLKRIIAPSITLEPRPAEA